MLTFRRLRRLHMASERPGTFFKMYSEWTRARFSRCVIRARSSTRRAARGPRTSCISSVSPRKKRRRTPSEPSGSRKRKKPCSAETDRMVTPFRRRYLSPLSERYRQVCIIREMVLCESHCDMIASKMS